MSAMTITNQDRQIDVRTSVEYIRTVKKTFRENRFRSDREDKRNFQLTPPLAKMRKSAKTSSDYLIEGFVGNANYDFTIDEKIASSINHLLRFFSDAGFLLRR